MGRLVGIFDRALEKTGAEGASEEAKDRCRELALRLMEAARYIEAKIGDATMGESEGRAELGTLGANWLTSVCVRKAMLDDNGSGGLDVCQS